MLECSSGRRSTGDDLLQGIEVSSANETLVLYRVIAVLALAHEFRFLQARVCGHSAGLVFAGQLEHGVVQRMESGERDELKLVAHLRKFPLEHCDGRVVQILLPV